MTQPIDGFQSSLEKNLRDISQENQKKMRDREKRRDREITRALLQ